LAIPSNRQDFANYCLRKLGAPVIRINVADEQLDDRIDEALTYYGTFHFDGTDHVYYKYLVQSVDITNQYITLPENITGVVRVFDLGFFEGVGGMFSIKYQLALNDLYTLTSQSMTPYFMAQQNLAGLQDLLVGKKNIRFNRRANRLYVDTDWEGVIVAGTYIIVEAYQVLDPDTYTSIWADPWLQRYATALIKKNWAENLSKFQGLQLPGQVDFNATQMFLDADATITKLEAELTSTWALPPDPMIG
jgi:hypothetical protein